MIYFIRSPAGPIKIGVSIRLSQRLKQLVAEHGEGLEVLAVVDGSYDEEKALHGRFAHLRTVGEWFEPGDDLVGFIVSDGQSWDGTDEVPNGEMRPESGPGRPPKGRDDMAVKVDRAIVSKARAIAQDRGITIAEYLSEKLDGPVSKDFAAMLRANEAKGHTS